MNEATLSLGEIAATGPGARGVLLSYQLDFCCKGKRTLEVACAKAGLNTAEIVAELQKAMAEPSDQRDWSEAPLNEITAYIVEHYHRPLAVVLDGVVTAAERVERVHGSKPACPVGLAEHLRGLRTEMVSHMAKEEQVLFPAIDSGKRGSMLSAPVTLMMSEHEDHGDSLLANRAFTTDFVPPPEACATWRTLYEQLEKMEADLMDHIHLENHVLFPRALQDEAS
jgi:regulator of cell morphogenesis and NO signaling